MKIVDILKQDKMSLSFEVFPPKKETSFESVKAATESIAALGPAFMSVTYGAGGGVSHFTLDIAKNLKQIESNEAGVTMVEKANDIMQKSFKIGAASFIQLRDTEDALMAARLAYYQAIYNYLVAESDLEYVLGNTHYVRN